MEHVGHFLVRRGREDRHPGNLGEQHHVEHAVVAGPVVAGDAGPVQAEDDREPVQADVVDRPGPRPG